MNNPNDNRLVCLKDSDFEIADNEPNILGWTIKDEQDRTIGEVEDLIFDPQTRQVRYLVMDLEGNVLDLEPRDVLVPIGVVQLHTSDDEVLLPGVTADTLRGLPPYEKDRFTRDTEAAVVSAFGGTAAAGSDFYGTEHFDEDRAYRNRQGTQSVPVIEEEMQVGKKEVETGGARLRTRVVEKPVEAKVNLREEHVKVERTPVDRPVTDADINAFKEGEVEIKERAEVPVVNKEARVVEEINLSKEVSEREATVQGTVRSTDVKVESTNPNTPPNQQNPNLPPNSDPQTNRNPNDPNNPNRPDNPNR